MASADQIAQYDQAWTAAVEKAFAAYDADDWQHQGKKTDECQIYLRYPKDSSFAQVKGVVTVNAPLATVEEAIKTTKVVDKDTPSAEREGNVERRIVSQVNGGVDGAGFFYVIVESPSRLVSQREFLMYQKLARKDNKVCLCRTSIDNETIVPPSKGSVRGNMAFQAFIAEPVNDSTTTLTFVCHADPCGSIPSMIYNSAATKQGLSALRIKKQIEGK